MLTSIKPPRVDSRGGTVVTVFGAGFVPGCRVFANSEELVAEVIDTFTLKFIAPAVLGRLMIAVESPSGKRSPYPGLLELIEGPTVLRANPDAGPVEGGIDVVLEGTGFSEGCAINLFGTHAPDVVFLSETRLKFALPPAGDGPLDGPIAVTLFDGLTGPSAEGVFRYRPLAPKLTGVEPPNAWVTGGKLVTVVGVDFHPKAAVLIDGRPAKVLRFKGDKAIEIEIPPGREVGPVDVAVENPNQRVTTLAGGFSYEPVPTPPKLIDVYPKTGSTSGGASFRIVGENFSNDVGVRVGEVTCVRRVLGPKLMEVDIPARTLEGKVAVELFIESIVIRSEDAFEYISPIAPRVMSIDPRSGPASGGTRLHFEGENFLPGATVRINGELCKTVVVKSPTQMECVTPPSNKTTGLVDIEVMIPEGKAGISPKAFRYEAMPPPSIATISPTRGRIEGGTELSIEGKNFADNCTVIVGGKPVKTKKISGSVLEAHTEAGEDGQLVDISVKNPDGQSAVQKRAFQYDARYKA